MSLQSNIRLVGNAGTNKVMAGELSRLACRAFDDFRLAPPKKCGPSTLVYPFDPRLARLAVEHHRTAARVLWDLYASRARRLEPLYDDVLDQVSRDTRPWLADGHTLSVSAKGVRDFAAGERQIVGTIKNAIIDGAARRGIRLRVDPRRPDVSLVVRLFDGELTVSIDLAGRAMHQRGYRVAQTTAPLRETVAAVLVMLSRWDARREVLIDPMAGSGTIAIEAAMMARGAPLWAPRFSPALNRLEPFASDGSAAPRPLFADTRPAIVANELDTRAIAAARENVAAAGAKEIVTLHGDFRDLTRERIERSVDRGLQAGVILCNPPYGERLADEEVVDLYVDLGRWCRDLGLTGWRAAFLVAHEAFEHAFGGRARVRKPLFNGPLKGTFYLYDLP